MSFRTCVFGLILADQMQRSFRKFKFMSKIVSGLWAALILGVASFTDQNASGQDSNAAGPAQPLKPPANGKINVAFIISDGADVMDIAGPWEVFSDAMLTSQGKPWHESDGDDMMMPFNTYTVSDSLKPVNAANGLVIVPNYSF